MAASSQFANCEPPIARNTLQIFRLSRQRLVHRVCRNQTRRPTARNFPDRPNAGVEAIRRRAMAIDLTGVASEYGKIVRQAFSQPMVCDRPALSGLETVPDAVSSVYLIHRLFVATLYRLRGTSEFHRVRI